MSRIDAGVRSRLRLALLFLLAGCAAWLSPAASGAEIRRPTVRMVDVVLALIEGEVPVEAWSAVDGPMAGYSARVSAEIHAWGAQPALDRLVERPSEFPQRIREQRRRNERLLAEQRRLADELRAALLEAGAPPDRADAFLAWLQARAVDRALRSLRDGLMPPIPLPPTHSVAVDAATRRAIAEAVVPHVGAYTREAEAFFDLMLDREVGRPPTTDEGHVLEGFHATLDQHLARRALVAKAWSSAAEQSAKAHRAALAAAGDSGKEALAWAITEEIDRNAQQLRPMLLAVRLAPRLHGLDESERARVAAAAAAAKERLFDEVFRAIDALQDVAEDRYGGSGGWIDPREREGLVADLRATLSEVLEERDRAFSWLTHVGHFAPGRFDESTLTELLGPDAWSVIGSADDGRMGIRLLRRRDAGASHWQSLAQMRPVSPQLESRLAEIADGEPGATEVLRILVQEHRDRWNETVPPLQEVARGHTPPRGATAWPRDPTVEWTLDPKAVQRDFGALRQRIEALEDELAASIRAVARDRAATERWLLDRAFELCAPETGAGSGLWAPVALAPLTIDAVLRAAEVDDGTRTVAEAIAWADAPDLVAALRERQAGSERLRLMMLWRNANAPAAGTPGQFARHAEEFERLCGQLGIDLARSDRAVDDAWASIHEAWSIALPEAAPSLRRAWLTLLIPELADEPIVCPAIVRRAAAGLPRDDPRQAALEAIASRHEAQRRELVVAAAETILDLPRPLIWLNALPGDSVDPRFVARDAFRDAERELAGTTLRDAIALLGLEEFERAPMLRRALAMLADASWNADM